MIAYFGGKYRQSKFIESYVPDDISFFASAFGGAFWEYFNSDIYMRNVPVYYNDCNIFMVNLIESCRRYCDFYAFMSDIPSQDRERFKKYKSNILNTENVGYLDFNRAMQYAYIMTQSFNAINAERATFIDLRGKYSSKFNSFRKRLLDNKIQRRLDNLTSCSNLDFEKFIETIDEEGGFIYCDPPYFGHEKDYALHNFKLEDHQRLSDTLKGIQGRFMLSYYYFDDLLKLYPKDAFVWVQKDFKKPSSALSNKKQSVGGEILIMNYKKGKT